MCNDKRGEESRQTGLSKSIGSMFVSSINAFIDRCIEESGKEQLQELFTMENALSFLRDNSREYSQLTRFLLSVKLNPDSKENKDRFIVTQVLLDDKNKPVILNGNECLSRIITVDNVDIETVKFLDGAETKIYIGKRGGDN